MDEETTATGQVQVTLVDGNIKQQGATNSSRSKVRNEATVPVMSSVRPMRVSVDRVRAAESTVLLLVCKGETVWPSNPDGLVWSQWASDCQQRRIQSSFMFQNPIFFPPLHF